MTMTKIYIVGRKLFATQRGKLRTIFNVFLNRDKSTLTKVIKVQVFYSDTLTFCQQQTKLKLVISRKIFMTQMEK